MQFEVPLLPDEQYVGYLAEHAHRLHSVHFSLHSPLAGDGRPPMSHCQPEFLMQLLGELPGPRKYALINSRFAAPDNYFEPSRLNALAELLESLRQRGMLDGIVYADQYLLQALSDARPDICSELEAVPSVNAMLDSAHKVMQRLHYISATAFRPPRKILLDRGLNRDMSALQATAAELRAALPGTAIVLLANEGCLPHCPFKAAHDSFIALSSLPCDTRTTFGLNARLGCGRQFATDQRLLFQSPFIRPEDAPAYAPHADALKLCGRTLGPGAVERIVGAYLAGGHDGNLLDILDTLEFLAPVMHIDNSALPAEFQAVLANCGGACKDCGYCASLAARHVKRCPPGGAIGRA